MTDLATLAAATSGTIAPACAHCEQHERDHETTRRALEEAEATIAELERQLELHRAEAVYLWLRLLRTRPEAEISRGAMI